MSCYMRHMAWLMDGLGISDDSKNRKRVDLAVRDVLGFGPDAQCPQVWAAIKALPEEERLDLVPNVREVLEA